MYPTIHFTRKYRLAFMITLIITFFVISPLIILYTTGYRFDWNTKEIKQTGVLSVDGLPQDMNVYLNDVKIDKALPIRLPNRTPGNYTLKLSRDGYQDWTKEISIESKKTTYIKNITLFKNISVSKILDNFDKKIIDLLSSVSGNYLAITSIKDNIYSVDIYDTVNNKTTPIARFSSVFPPKIEWSPTTDFLLINNQSTNKNFNWQIINAGNPIQTHTYSTVDPITKWQWSTSLNTPVIWLENNNKLIELSTTMEKFLSNSLNNIKTWFIRDDGELVTYSGDAYNLDWNNQVFVLNDDVRIIVSANDYRVIYKTYNETKVAKIINDKTLQISTLPVYQTTFNLKTNEWLAFSDWELWTIYDDGDSELLHRTGEQMNFVLPLDEYGVILLANKSKITAFNPGYYVSHTLFTGDDIKSITADIINRKIFFWGNVNEKEGVFVIEY